MTDTERAISFFENALENCVMVARKPFETALAALRRTAEDDKAMEEGRLVVLPCKVGDDVYWMWTDGEGRCEGPIYECSVYEVCVTKNGVELSRGPHDGRLGMVGIHPPMAVFLTRQEAEVALKGE